MSHHSSIIPERLQQFGKEVLRVVCRDTEQRITNTLGALYVATLFLGIMNSIFVQPVVSDERAVFYRERAAGMYSVEPWYLAMVSASNMSSHDVYDLMLRTLDIGHCIAWSSITLLCFPLRRVMSMCMFSSCWSTVIRAM